MRAFTANYSVCQIWMPAAYRKPQSAHAGACLAEIPCWQRAHGDEPRRSALQAEFWRDIGAGDTSGIEPLQVQPKVERNMRYFLKKHDPGALFSKIANPQRGQSVSEANHAARGQTAKRRDSESVAAAGTKLQRSVASEHDSRERAEAAGVIAERNRGRHNNECLRVECKVTSGVTTPEVRRGKGAKMSMARATARRPSSSKSPQAVPISTPGARGPGWPQSLPPINLVGATSPQERWIRRPNKLGLTQLRRIMPTT